jgi:hypothetical protein
MVDFLVLVEGGGATRAEQANLRKGFQTLFGRVLGSRRRPRVVCAGGRGQAFNDFCRAIEGSANNCLLLVDSEGPVSEAGSPWDHVARRAGDQWQRPSGATDEQIHFMVEAMEAWLVADRDVLASYYGSEFNEKKLPRRPNLEECPKEDLTAALEAATKTAKTKGAYRKSHGFELVGKLDPTKIRTACPTHAVRFFAELEKCAGRP